MSPDTTLYQFPRAVNGADLLDTIKWEQRSVTVYGKTYPQPRLTKWYADVPYRYSNLTWEAAPLPPLVEELRVTVEEMTGHTFNSVLCNLYRSVQDTIGWHADDEPIFGGDPIVASLSFGAGRTFKLRHKQDPKNLHSFYLGDGTLLVMSRGVQKDWEHSVPRCKKEGIRINLTFRLTM